MLEYSDKKPPRLKNTEKLWNAVLQYARKQKENKL